MSCLGVASHLLSMHAVPVLLSTLREMRSDAVRGHLDLLILAVLSEQRMHGYALIDELRTRSQGEFDLPEGTVYPALHRLEAAGYLTSDWDVVSGRRRRYYRLTPRGLTALGEERSHWERLSSAVVATITGTGARVRPEH
jgi:PadR family transcriptional regulator PadR